MLQMSRQRVHSLQSGTGRREHDGRVICCAKRRGGSAGGGGGATTTGRKELVSVRREGKTCDAVKDYKMNTAMPCRDTVPASAPTKEAERLSTVLLQRTNARMEFIGPSCVGATGARRVNERGRAMRLAEYGGGRGGGRGRGGGGDGGGGGGGKPGRGDGRDGHALLVALFAILPGILCAGLSMAVFTVHCRVRHSYIHISSLMSCVVTTTSSAYHTPDDVLPLVEREREREREKERGASDMRTLYDDSVFAFIH